MSWNFELNAANKGEAKALVAKIAHNHAGYGLTQAASEAIIAQIDALPPVEDAIVAIKSNGHIDATGGEMSASVRLVRIERIRLDAE